MTANGKGRGRHAWRQELHLLLKKHNDMPSLRGKTLNHASQAARAEGLARMFVLLVEAGFRVVPASLGGRHIEFLVHYWTMDPRALEGLRARNSSLAMLRIPLSDSYIQQQLSFLRALCKWLGKPGLVMAATRYVCDPQPVTGVSHASGVQTDKAASTACRAMIDRVTQADAIVGLQLEVLLAFGLPKQQAVMFCPTLADVPLHALPPAAGDVAYLAFVRHQRGTAGGRVRLTAVRTDEQRAVLERARMAAPSPGSHIGHPGLNLAQATTRFSNVLRRSGVSLRKLALSGDAQRNKFETDLHVKLDMVPTSKSELPGTDQAFMAAVYSEIKRRLERRRRNGLTRHIDRNTSASRA